MRIHLMMTLLAGTMMTAAALAPAPAEAQSRLGRPVATGVPSIARAPFQRPVGQTRPAVFDGRPRPVFNGGANSNIGGNLVNRPARPGGGWRPNNVVIVNGRPGAGYYQGGHYNGGGGYFGGNGYYGGGNDRYDDGGDNFLEFVGKAAAITAGVSVVSKVIGTIVKDKPANDCKQQIQNGKVFLLCDGVWYTPAAAEGQTGYKVVAPPGGAGQ